MQRTAKLSQGYEELKTDLLEEVNMADARIIKPATEARDWIQPLKKVIKKREDRKVSCLRYAHEDVKAEIRSWTSKNIRHGSIMLARRPKDRNETMQTWQRLKPNCITQKRYVTICDWLTDFNLARCIQCANLGASVTNQDFCRCLAIHLLTTQQEYTIADDHLKSKLPPVVTAAFSLLPHLLSSQIMTQNSLLGNYYTMLHDYCSEENFPSPPPPMGEIINAWEAEHRPVQREIERFACIAGGKAVRKSMKTDIQMQNNGANGRNGNIQRRSSSQSFQSIQSYHSASLKPPASPAISTTSDPPSPDPHTRPRISSIPSQTLLSLATPNYNSSAVASPSPGDLLAIHAPAGPRADYFTRDRLPSSSSLASVAAKKKPPPPPPKRLPSSQGLWVTALYDFAGQGQGDLAFREGDRIKVVQKTNSTDEWWEGELKGVQGSFPANYCQAT